MKLEDIDEEDEEEEERSIVVKLEKDAKLIQASGGLWGIRRAFL